MPSGKFNLQKLHDEFMRQQEFVGRRSVETLRGYDASFKLLLTILPRIKIEDLTPEIMEKFFQILQKRERKVGNGKVKSGITNSTVGTYRSKLNGFFKWLIARGHLKKNPFDGIEYPKIAYEDRKYLSKSNVEKIIAGVISQPNVDMLKRKRDLVMCYLLLNTGVRRGELLGLRLLDVDFDRAELFVNWKTSKGRKDRVIPINKQLMGVLKDYVSCRNSSKIKYTTPSLLVSSIADNPLTKHGLKHWVEELKLRSGVNFHIHRFRHTFAMNLLHQGTDLAKLQYLLGHRNIKMTVQYLRCMPTQSVKADVENLSIDGLLDYPN